MGKFDRKQVYEYLFKRFSSKRYPKKKVRILRDYFKQLPLFNSALWALQKVKKKIRVRAIFEAAIPTRLKDSYRIDKRVIPAVETYYDDSNMEHHYKTIARRYHTKLEEQEFRHTFSLLHVIHPWFRERTIKWGYKWEVYKLGLRKKSSFFSYFYPAWGAYDNDLSGSQYYGALRQQWLYKHSGFKYHWFHVFTPLLYKYLNQAPFFESPLRKPFNVFTVLDWFIPQRSGRIQRLGHTKFKVYKQYFADLKYKQKLLDDWHGFRNGTKKPANILLDRKYIKKFYRYFDNVEYELAELKLQTKIRRQLIEIRYWILKTLLRILLFFWKFIKLLIKWTLILWFFIFIIFKIFY